MESMIIYMPIVMAIVGKPNVGKSSFINSDKLLVIYQSAKKSKNDKAKKLKWITFVGKLNKSKGYDIYGNAVCKILDTYKDWKGIVIGDEQRDKIIFQHKINKKLTIILKEKTQLKNDKLL